jgi:hypothetical protein
MPGNYEFFLFRQYSIAVKEWLGQVCNLSRYPKEENVLVIYSTPAVAFAKYIYPIVNGKQMRPTISFHLSANTYTQNENLLGWVTDYIPIAGTSTLEEVKPLLIYGLTYSLTIRTTLMQDADILIYQLLSNASKNKKAALRIDGQWAEIMAGDPRDETNLEPGEFQDKVIRYGIDLIIPRAYLPREYSEIPDIEEAQLDLQV